MPTTIRLSQKHRTKMARALAEFLKERGVELKHTHANQAIARILGFNEHSLAAGVGKGEIELVFDDPAEPPEIEKPKHNPETEQVVRLDPVRRAMYLDAFLRQTAVSTFLVPRHLTPTASAVVERVAGFLKNLVVGWAGAPASDKEEAIKELQGEMDDLQTMGLVLAIAPAEQTLITPLVTLPDQQALIASVLRKGEVFRYEVVPRIVDSDANGVRR